MATALAPKWRDRTFDRTKSLQELEQHDWGDPAPTDTGLVTRCMQLRRKPLLDFSAEDLRMMIGQQIGLSHLVVLAIEQLEVDPFIEGSFYAGDLLCTVLRLDEEFWASHPDSLQRIQRVVKRARTIAASRADDIGEAVRKEIEGAPRILRTAVCPTEEELCRMLRLVLNKLDFGAAIPDSPAFTEALSRLNWYLPGVIIEIHPEFNESFDDIVPRIAWKIGENTAEIRGLVWLISDQSLVPIHVRLQLAPDENELGWLELRLGESGPGGIRRSPYQSSGSIYKRLAMAEASEDPIHWAYEVGFGERQ